jgi:acyl-CoA thioesterase-2
MTASSEPAWASLSMHPEDRSEAPADRRSRRHVALQQLIADLGVEERGPDAFVGAVPRRNLPRMFGGQVLGQALLAAAATCAPDRVPHSMHCYFLAPGSPERPVSYQVGRMREGSAFSVRAVHARQGEVLLATVHASFHGAESFLEHEQSPRETFTTGLHPTQLPELEQTLSTFAADLPAWWTEDVPLDIRFVTPPTALSGGASTPARQEFWIRADGSMPRHPAVHAAMLAWASDLNLLDVALRPHGASWYGDRRVFGASLDHALWFHEIPDATLWLWCSQSNERTHNARALCTAKYRDRSGKLIATASQEGILRPVR